MPSNKETLFQDHLCAFLSTEHNYATFEASRLTNANHIIEKDLIAFIQNTQENHTFRARSRIGNATAEKRHSNVIRNAASENELRPPCPTNGMRL